MKFNNKNLIILLICFSALIISSETIKFFELSECFADLSLLSSKKRNQILHKRYSDKYNQSVKLEKNIPLSNVPFKTNYQWDNKRILHYLEKGDKFVKPLEEKISYCYPPDPIFSLPEYRILKEKESCISDYNINKKPKVPGVWSPPCTRDEDCYFFKLNKNYKNNFGKCNRGKCELPLGVIPIGYRDYIGEPLCHNCLNENVPSKCCESQQNDIIYPNLKGPDYAFKNDDIQRIEQGYN